MMDDMVIIYRKDEIISIDDEEFVIIEDTLENIEREPREYEDDSKMFWTRKVMISFSRNEHVMNHASLQLKRIRFYDPLGRVVPIAKVENPNGRCHLRRLCGNLVEGDGVWVDKNFKMRHRTDLLVSFDDDVVISGYSLLKHVVKSQRTPVSWKVYASIGPDWVLIDDIVDHVWIYREHEFIIQSVKELCKAIRTKEILKGVDVSQVDEAYFVNNFAEDELGSVEQWFRNGIPVYYLDLHDDIIVKDVFMRSSKLYKTFCLLNQLNINISVNIEELVTRIISIAYQIPADQARYQYCTIGNIIIYANVINMIIFSNWRRHYLICALIFFLEVEEREGLISILSVLSQGGNVCDPGKIQAFNTVILRAGEQLLNLSSDSYLSDNRSKNLLLLELENFLDDYKLKAFLSGLFEPAKFALSHLGRYHDDVHSPNPYITILMSTLNVRIPLFPDLHDSCKSGRINFLEVEELQGCFIEMLHPRNFGKKFESIDCCKISRPKLSTHVKMSHFLYDTTPFGVAHECIYNPIPEIKLYLQRFVHFFTADYFLEKAFMHLFSENHTQTLMDTVYDLYDEEFGVKEFDNAETITDWLYLNEEYIWQVERAKKFFGYIGLTKMDM